MNTWCTTARNITHWRRIPEPKQRTFIVSSFGKTYHVTGWKIGYVLAPAELMVEFRKVHQFNVFTANSAMQVGFASYMQDPTPIFNYRASIRQSATIFVQVWSIPGFKLLSSEGSYFQCRLFLVIEQNRTRVCYLVVL